MTGLAVVESLEPLSGKGVLIVGAGGGVGSFATQFAVEAAARVIANVRSVNEERYVANADDLEARGVTAVNFQLPASTELMQPVADALASGRIVAPPVTRISLAETPGVFAADSGGAPDGKTVIVLGA